MVSGDRERGKQMSTINELRDLQREYAEKRNNCHRLIREQDRNLLNCSPGIGTIRAARERENKLLEDAAGWQKRVDAIQEKLDEMFGLVK